MNKQNQNISPYNLSLKGYLYCSLGFLFFCITLITVFTTKSYSALQQKTLSDTLAQLSKQASQSVEATYDAIETWVLA